MITEKRELHNQKQPETFEENVVISWSEIVVLDHHELLFVFLSGFIVFFILHHTFSMNSHNKGIIYA